MGLYQLLVLQPAGSLPDQERSSLFQPLLSALCKGSFPTRSAGEEDDQHPSEGTVLVTEGVCSCVEQEPRREVKGSVHAGVPWREAESPGAEVGEPNPSMGL